MVSGSEKGLKGIKVKMSMISIFKSFLRMTPHPPNRC